MHKNGHTWCATQISETCESRRRSEKSCEVFGKQMSKRRQSVKSGGKLLRGCVAAGRGRQQETRGSGWGGK